MSRKRGEKRRKKKRRGSWVKESEERGDEAILSILASFCIRIHETRGKVKDGE